MHKQQHPLEQGSPSQEPATPTWEEQAHWLQRHLPEMRFQVKLHTPTIVTVWIGQDEEADECMRLVDILTNLFGAYNCGQSLNPVAATIFTVWIDHDPDAEKITRLTALLGQLFGAYACGPAATWSAAPPHASFGFWNQELLDNARRVFPLPDGLQPGPIIFLNPLSAAEWQRVEQAYNKQPEELPRHTT